MSEFEPYGNVEFFHKIMDILVYNRPDLEPTFEGGGAAQFCIAVKDTRGTGSRWWFGTANDTWGASLSTADGDDGCEYVDTDTTVNTSDTAEVAAAICTATDPGFVNEAVKVALEVIAHGRGCKNRALDEHKVLDAAWQPVCKAFPKIITGDLAIDIELDLSRALTAEVINLSKFEALLRQAIFHWLASNLRDEDETKTIKES